MPVEHTSSLPRGPQSCPTLAHQLPAPCSSQKGLLLFKELLKHLLCVSIGANLALPCAEGKGCIERTGPLSTLCHLPALILFQLLFLCV